MFPFVLSLSQFGLFSSFQSMLSHHSLSFYVYVDPPPSFVLTIKFNSKKCLTRTPPCAEYIKPVTFMLLGSLSMLNCLEVIIFKGSIVG